MTDDPPTTGDHTPAAQSGATLHDPTLPSHPAHYAKKPGSRKKRRSVRRKSAPKTLHTAKKFLRGE